MRSEIDNKKLHRTKGPATRNDFVNNIVNDARADAIFATLKAIVDDETSTISLTKSLRVAGPLDVEILRSRLNKIIGNDCLSEQCHCQCH